MASNVIIEKTHIERFFQPDLDFKSSLSSGILDIHQDQSEFISELIPYLYYHYNESPLDNIAKITNILLSNIKEEIKEKFYIEFGESCAKIKDLNGNSLIYRNSYLRNEDYLEFLRKIRILINSCNDLNIEEKGELCKLERYFMKKYLQRINFR